MGAITRAAANNITTGGVILPAGINDASVASISALSGVNTSDGITLISSQTASGSSSINFTSGIDSTYRTYLFVMVNIHAAAANQFGFNASTDGGSNYNVTKTSTHFAGVHNESNTETSVQYKTSEDLAQGTGLQSLAIQQSIDDDHSYNGRLYLFSPSDTTYVKHYLSISDSNHGSVYNAHSFVGGYCNTTSAINAIRFQQTSGNIDGGTIYLYGIN